MFSNTDYYNYFEKSFEPLFKAQCLIFYHLKKTLDT